MHNRNECFPISYTWLPWFKPKGQFDFYGGAQLSQTSLTVAQSHVFFFLIALFRVCCDDVFVIIVRNDCEWNISTDEIKIA